MIERTAGKAGVAGLLAAAACFATVAPASGQDSRATRRTPIVEVFERSKDAVVNISCTQRVEVSAAAMDPFEHFFGVEPRRLQREVTSVGSGFVLHPDGYVVTNAHVVLKTVDQRVIFADKKEYKARPVAIDTDRDLAVLKIDADHPLPALPLGRSNDLMIGETVIAIGNPLGYQHSLTTGVVSALDRTLQFREGVEYHGLIQTDASINPGNSGGPLLNILGECIGITTAIRGDAQNIGFAIPADALRAALPSMLSLERLKRVRVGMQVGGWKDVRIVEIQDKSPAQEAKLEAGDHVLRIDDRPVSQDIDVCIRLLTKKAGDRVPIEVERRGKRIQTVITLRAIPVPDGSKLVAERFGMHIEQMSADVAQRLDLPGALIVTKVDPGGPADRAGIERGMIIVTVGSDFPRDLDHVGLLLENVRPGDAVIFRIWQIEGRRIIQYPPVRLLAR